MTGSRIALLVIGVLLILTGLARYLPVISIRQGKYLRVRAVCTGYDRRMAPSDEKMQYYPMFRFTIHGGRVMNVRYNQAGKQFEIGQEYVVYYRQDQPSVIYCPRDRYRLIWTALFVGFGILLLILAMT